MANYDSNYEIAQEISARIGNSPVPFDSVYSICLAIYQELGGTEETFDSVYSILLEILPLATEIGHVIDDNAISSGKTWSSSKINSELNGKQNTLAAGEGIIISGDTISATATGGDDAIEEVSELPNASENKNKLFRLDNGEKDVYAAKLLSSETITTNRLPDEQQIDKAYLIDADNSIYYYKDTFKLICTDGEINGYVWQNEDYHLFTLDNAVDTTLESSLYAIEDFEGWDVSGNTATTSVNSVADVEEATGTLEGWEIIAVIPAIYNAPESAQIGNAYLNDGDNCYYNGVEYTLNYSDDVSITAYGWVYEGGTYPIFYTPKKASEIYYQNMYDGQGHIAGKYTDAVGYFIDFEEYPIVNNTITLDYPSSEAENAIGDYQILYIPQLNAPDSEQVDNAYIDEGYFANRWLYEGNETTITYDEHLVTVYTWQCSTDRHILYTSKRAFEIYNTNKDSDDVQIYALDDDDVIVELTFSNGDLNEISTVKYQRSEVVEDWEWEKVATEQYVDDAIDNIEFPEYVAGEGIAIDSANTISCTVKPITDVSALPDASENKDKLFRLDNGEKDVYAAKLVSSETITTNRLPDAQQIDKAYLWDEEEAYYYKGAWKLILSDGEIDGFVWGVNGGSYIFTLTNCADTTLETLYGCFDSESWNLSGNTASTNDYSVSEYKNDIMTDSLMIYGMKAVISATYNAPESAQIGNATIEYDGYIWTYTGEAGTADDTETTYNGYKWENNENNYIVSTKKASEIFYVISSGLYIGDFVLVEHNGQSVVQLDRGNTDSLYIPQLNAPDSEQVGHAQIEMDDTTYTYIGVGEYIDTNNIHKTLYGWKTSGDYYLTTSPAIDIYGANTEVSGYYIDVIDNGDGTFNLDNEWYGFHLENVIRHNFVSYQRTEVVEDWDWKNITQPAIIDVEELPDEVTDANKGNIYRPEGDNNYIAALGDEGLEWQSIATNNYVDYTVGYNVPVIQGTANLNYNQDYTISGISNVVLSINEPYSAWTDAGIANVTVSFTLNVSGMEIGSVYATGTMAKYSMNIGPISGTNYRFTFPFVKLGAQPTQGTLFIDYIDSDDTWTVKLQEN